MNYEENFDKFYKNNFKHDLECACDDLLLDSYPYTVNIDIPNGGKWLELGIGSGRVVYYHRKKLEKISCVGLDYSACAIELCKQFLPSDVKLYVADLKNLPVEIKNKKFDLITLFGSIQTVGEKKDWIPAICSLMELLKDEGKIGFSLHPLSFLEIVRCIKSPSTFKYMVTDRFLTKELKKHKLEGKFTIEKHNVFVLLQKITACFGIRSVKWFGFDEYVKTPVNIFLTKWFKRIFPFFAFGHYWVWITKTNRKNV